MNRQYYFTKGVDRVKKVSPIDNLEEKKKAIDSLITLSREKLKFVGLSVGAVSHGETVFLKGYGVRELSKPESKVDENTIFGIGSTTKAFTAYALDYLVNTEGKLSWTDKVTKYIPEFKVMDHQTTKLLQVRDLVVHSSGVARYDMVHIYNSSLKRNDLVNHLPYLYSQAEVRETFGYSNIMVAVGGIVAEKVTGKRWEDLVHDCIFDKLGMSRTFASLPEMKKVPNVQNVALPHSIRRNVLTLVDWYDASNVAPSGTIISCAADMVKWVKRQLELKGKSTDLHLPQVLVPTDLTNGQPMGYAFGWFVELFNGRILVRHDGEIFGFVSEVELVPEENLGVAILSNCDNMPTFIEALGRKIIDILLSKTATTQAEIEIWVAAQAEKLADMEEAVKEADEDQTMEKFSVTDAHEYEASFRSEGFGVVTVSYQNPDLYAKYNDLVYVMQAKKRPDYFTCFNASTNVKLQGWFLRDLTGYVSGLFLDLDSTVAPASFERVPLAEWSEIGYLKNFVKTFENYQFSIQFTVHEKKRVLVASGPSQYSGELKPYRKNWFRLEFTYFEFKVGQDGKHRLKLYVGGDEIRLKEAKSKPTRY